MTREEIFKYVQDSNYAKKLNLTFNSDNIIYNLNGIEYEIELYSDHYQKMYFSCSYCSMEIKKMKVGMYTETLTSDKVILKFAQIIKWIKKTDEFIQKKQEHVKKLRTTIGKYIRKNVNYQGDINFYISFKKEKKHTKRHTKDVPFNTLTNKLSDIRYDITVRFKYDDIHYYYTFIYDDNKLSLLSKNESYFDKGKNVTGIIRSEKLKSLFE